MIFTEGVIRGQGKTISEQYALDISNWPPDSNMADRGTRWGDLRIWSSSYGFRLFAAPERGSLLEPLMRFAQLFDFHTKGQQLLLWVWAPKGPSVHNEGAPQVRVCELFRWFIHYEQQAVPVMMIEFMQRQRFIVVTLAGNENHCGEKMFADAASAIWTARCNNVSWLGGSSSKPKL